MKKTIYVHGYDYNCVTDEVRLDFDTAVEKIDPSCFTVTETKQVTDFSKAPEFPVVVMEEKRTVEDVYYVDGDGNRCEEKTSSIILKLNEDPEHGCPLLFDFHSFFNTWSQPYEMKIKYGDQTIICTMDDFVTQADDWSIDTFTASDGVTYRYAHFEPEGGSDRTVIWLHGIGEGGTELTDPRIAVLANKADVLKREAFQKAVGKANILVPQCPTYWMDRTGDCANRNMGQIVVDGTSFYTESLVELICDYLARTETEKTVVAGCSNGGYMTMLLAMKYPKVFDGYVPVCEAVPDTCITDAQIDVLAKQKLYFVYSKDDPTVIPEKHEVPTLERLKKAGAENIHVSVTDHVIDTSGSYFLDENGRATKQNTGIPYQYSGHWSWIYFFNNECSADGLTAWDFISDCLK